MRTLIFLALLVISFGLPSAAATAQDASKPQALSEDDLKRLTEKAEKGDVGAQLIYRLDGDHDGIPCESLCR